MPWATVTANEVSLSSDGAPLCTTFVYLDEQDKSDRKPTGTVPLAMALGVSALPAPPTDDGYAELYTTDEIPGLEGVAVGGVDSRSAGVIAELGPGETALHSTGEGFDARVFCKDQLVALIVGDDTIFAMNRKTGTCSLAIAGHAVEVSEKNGIVLSEAGGAAITMKDGTIWLKGTVVLGDGAMAGKQYLVTSPSAPIPTAPGTPVLCAAPGAPPAPPLFVSSSGVKA